MQIQVPIQLTEVLYELGVRPNTLTQTDRTSLDQDGYMIVPKLLPPDQAATMAARLDAIAAEEGENAGKDFHTEKGTTRLGSLINKDPMFDICFLHPRALAAVDYIMQGNFALSSITGRAALPGEGLQNLHRDPHSPDSANILWAISDFTRENGPTRLIPGSHRYANSPHEAMQDAQDAHPDEIYLIVPAGSLCVINGKTWHGGTRNRSDRPRHLISAFCMPRGCCTQPNRRLSAAAYQRLSEAARFVIDYEYEL